MFRSIVKYIIFLLFISSLVFSGSTGKIGGRIVDNKTGKPLAGVNVIVTGTGIGAASGLDGSYMIINVPPGTYSINWDAGYLSSGVYFVHFTASSAGFAPISQIQKLMLVK